MQKIPIENVNFIVGVSRKCQIILMLTSSMENVHKKRTLCIEWHMDISLQKRKNVLHRDFHVFSFSHTLIVWRSLDTRANFFPARFRIQQNQHIRNTNTEKSEGDVVCKIIEEIVAKSVHLSMPSMRLRLLALCNRIDIMSITIGVLKLLSRYFGHAIAGCALNGKEHTHANSVLNVRKIKTQNERSSRR